MANFHVVFRDSDQVPVSACEVMYEGGEEACREYVAEKLSAQRAVPGQENTGTFLRVVEVANG